MPQAPLPADEVQRIAALRRTNLLDTPIEERFERITRLACRVLGTPIAAISLVDAERQWFKSIQGLPVSQTPRKQAFCGFTILGDQPLVVRDARADQRFADNPLVCGDPNIVFYAGFPVRACDGSRVGSLCIIDRRPRHPSHEDLQILRDLAALAESEIMAGMHDSVQRDLVEQCDELARAAKIDSLTRVWNHEAIHELLSMRIRRLARGEAEDHAAVIMADLDHFKQINDAHGHVVGDEVLRQVTARMLGAIRESDSLGRYGGEEFMIVLGRCRDCAEANAVAQRVRARIAEAPFVTEAGTFEVTISLGVAVCAQAQSVQIADLVARADEALYEAKKSGRNRVQVASFTPAVPAAA